MPHIDRRLLRELDFEDYREFAIYFGDWAYSTDFTDRGRIYNTTFDRILREFIKFRKGGL